MVTTTQASSSTKMAIPPIEGCEDMSRWCETWAGLGECYYSPSIMLSYCKRSCNACPPPDGTTPIPTSGEWGILMGILITIIYCSFKMQLHRQAFI